MKKLFTLALALIMVLSLAACGSKADPAPSGTNAPEANQSEQQPTGGVSDAAPEAGTWPDNEWTQKIPKPAAGEVGTSGTMGSENQTFYIGMSWTREEAAAYCDEIISSGVFDKDAFTYYKDSGTESLSVLLEAASSDGWEVAVSNDEIRVIRP